MIDGINQNCHSSFYYKGYYIIIDHFKKGVGFYNFKWMAINSDFTFKVFADTKEEVIKFAKQKVEQLILEE